MAQTYDEFLTTYPFARALPGFTKEMARFIEDDVVPGAMRLRGLFDTAHVLFEARKSAFFSSLDKSQKDVACSVIGHVERVAGQLTALMREDGVPRKRLIRSGTGDQAKVTALLREVPGSVGLYFVVWEAGIRYILLKSLPVLRADIYGENLTLDRGHDDVWHKTQQLGGTVLAKQGLPLCVLTNDYDTFPRGRMVYHPADERYTLLVGRRVQGQPELITDLKNAFAIGTTPCSTLVDDHYETRPPLGGSGPSIIRHLGD